MKYYTDKQSQLAIINGDNHSDQTPAPCNRSWQQHPLHTELFLARGLLFSSTVSVCLWRGRHLFLDILNSLEHLHHTNKQIISEKEKMGMGIGGGGGVNPKQSDVWFP